MPTIVHFDLPADDMERATKFYEKLDGAILQYVLIFFFSDFSKRGK